MRKDPNFVRENLIELALQVRWPDFRLLLKLSSLGLLISELKAAGSQDLNHDLEVDIGNSQERAIQTLERCAEGHLCGFMKDLWALG